MSHAQTIRIANETDIVLLRMRVRDLARDLGLNLGDQARISLAAASIAKDIGLGVTYPGQARIDDYCCDGHSGVRVVCTGKNSRTDSTPCTIGDARWMVDEWTFETLPLGEVRLTLVKWRT
jgi:hypothetical protein